jgi:hypothetical protein
LELIVNAVGVEILKGCPELGVKATGEAKVGVVLKLLASTDSKENLGG